MSQNKINSLKESLVQTFFGTIFGYVITFIIFPLFGIYCSPLKIGGLTLSFTLIALVKNYFTRRLFNHLHSSDNVSLLGKDQKKSISFLEGTFQTLTGTLISFVSSIFLYPLFGIDAGYGKIGSMTIVYTLLSLLKNYFVRRYFENKRKKSI